MYEVWTKDTVYSNGEFILHGRYASLADARAVAKWMTEKHGPAYVV